MTRHLLTLYIVFYNGFLCVTLQAPNGIHTKNLWSILCFWSGQGGKGEWKAVVSIYNSPGNLSSYVVEVARFTWHQIQVKYNGTIIVDFPQVTNDTTSSGYATFSVQV